MVSCRVPSASSISTGEGGAGAQQDPLATEGREARQLGRQRVGSGRQVDQPVVALFVGDGDHRAQQLRRGCGDGDAGERAALRVADVAAKTSLTGLRQRGMVDESRNTNSTTTGRNMGILLATWPTVSRRLGKVGRVMRPPGLSSRPFVHELEGQRHGWSVTQEREPE